MFSSQMNTIENEIDTFEFREVNTTIVHCYFGIRDRFLELLKKAVVKGRPRNILNKHKGMAKKVI